MGVHWASEGTVAHRLHALTKQRMFQGPGANIAQEVRALTGPVPTVHAIKAVPMMQFHP